MKKISRRSFLLVLLSACNPLPSVFKPGASGSPPTVLPRPTSTSTQPIPTFMPFPTATGLPTQPVNTLVPINEVLADGDTNCQMPILAPTQPPFIPSPNEVDRITGRHMMGTMQVLDLSTYRLEVSGLVDNPLSLTYDDLRCMPKVTETVTTTCYFFSDTATWSGVLIREVLNRAGVQSHAQKVIQNSPDDANRTVTIDMAMDPHNFLAYLMGDHPLPILFGFPLRSIFINVAGQYSVKWLTSLKVI